MEEIAREIEVSGGGLDVEEVGRKYKREWEKRSDNEVERKEAINK